MEDTKDEGTKIKKRSRNVKEVPTERLRTIPSVLFPVILQLFGVNWFLTQSHTWNMGIIDFYWFLTSRLSSPRWSRRSARPWWRGGWPAASPAGSRSAARRGARPQARGDSGHSCRDSRQSAWRSDAWSRPTLAIINSWEMRVITDIYKRCLQRKVIE